MAIIIVVVTVELTLSPLGLSNFHFWAQMVVGSSWPDHNAVLGISRIAFAVVIGTIVFVTYLPILGFGWIILQLVRVEWSGVMKWRDLIYLRDDPIEDRVLELIWEAFRARNVPLSDRERLDITQGVELAFKEGENEWVRNELVELVGRAQAAEYLQQRDQPVS